MINKNTFISIKYITNFNPFLYKNYNKFKFINKNKIYCKNFFLFLFLLKYLNNLYFYKNVIIFIKPFKKNLINILKAPYKNKLSRHQLSIVRYNINFKLDLKLILINIKNLSEIFIFLKNLKYFFNFLDSNIIYKNKFLIYINFSFKNFFKIN